MLLKSALFVAYAFGCAVVSVAANNGSTTTHNTSTEVDVNDKGTTLRILAGSVSDLFVLEFTPDSTPPRLDLKHHFPDVIRNAAFPWITRHPNNNNLFVVANDNHDEGELSSFSYDDNSGNLTLLDRVLSKGSCAHIAVSPDGGYVHIASLYSNGNGSNGAIVPIDPRTGKFGKVDIPDFLNFGGYELQPGQLNASQLLRHPHHWTFHPFLPVAYLSDLGADLVRRYQIVSPGQLAPLEPIQQRIASGPRRSIIHPAGMAIYTLHEIDSTLSVGKIDVNTPYGNVTVMQEGIDMLPPGSNLSANVFQGSEFQLSTDGRFLYAGSRNNTAPPSGTSNKDPIAIFSVSQNGTYIERIDVVETDLW
ncbi:uncharacterized protein I303_105648 [Kwoniella dejecticola CBS 10117]|uniref:6-phosphogluconolactonase n=1 Tax=Kwoniella dejecticola CBS 10117 TaxID=1296121 RepID=A0A1A6A010_9TREE|nr:uncharacterized protein I303_05670 [Kwoniella dejecticola CBS 10117]OBR83392.1 hypothetical protein I303_05670 [Kwoniella dejecticola CBS 10117]